MNADNFIIVKALEDIDTNKAIELISTPNLDPKQLSSVLQTALTGGIKLKTGETLNLNKETIIAGIRNRFNQITKDIESNEK